MYKTSIGWYTKIKGRMGPRADAVYTKIQWHVCIPTKGSTSCLSNNKSTKRQQQKHAEQQRSCVPLSHFDKECEDDSKTLQMMIWIKLQFEGNVPLVPESIFKILQYLYFKYLWWVLLKRTGKPELIPYYTPQLLVILHSILQTMPYYSKFHLFLKGFFWY